MLDLFFMPITDILNTVLCMFILIPLMIFLFLSEVNFKLLGILVNIHAIRL